MGLLLPQLRAGANLQFYITVLLGKGKVLKKT